MEEEIKKALYKKAVGYTAKEVVEEYGGEDGNLVKKKISKKHIPPDMTAIKTLIDLDQESSDLASKSDEELEEMLGQLNKELGECMSKNDK